MEQTGQERAATAGRSGGTGGSEHPRDTSVVGAVNVSESRPGGVLALRTWPAPGPEVPGWHGPGDDYVWACWVGTLGPTATLAWWQMARALQENGPHTIELAELARDLGLGGRLGRSGPLWRALGRLVRFGAARLAGPVLEVRPALADLSVSALARGSDSARARHAAEVAARATTQNEPFEARTGTGRSGKVESFWSCAPSAQRSHSGARSVGHGGTAPSGAMLQARVRSLQATVGRTGVAGSSAVARGDARSCAGAGEPEPEVHPVSRSIERKRPG